MLCNISHYDVLRSDKSISSHGWNPEPFLDKELTTFYLNMPIQYRNHAHNKQCEKYFIRKSIEIFVQSFAQGSIMAYGSICDGVSSIEKSWYETIQENVGQDVSGAQ